MYNPCNEIMPQVEVYQRWLNDHTRIAVRYGISTRKTHRWHTLTTTGITLADRRRVAMVVPVCLLPIPSVMNNAGSYVDVPVQVDMNSLRAYPQLPGILLNECIRLRESLTLLCWYELVNGDQT